MKNLVSLLFQVSLVVVVFIFGSLFVHFVVMVIDVYTYHGADKRETSFFAGYISQEMFPMMVVYGSLSVIIFILWAQAQKALKQSHEARIELMKHKTILETARKLTSVIVEHIAASNGKVLHWIAVNREKGKQPPKVVENSCSDIGKALQAFSQIAFSTEFNTDCPLEIDEIVSLLDKEIDANSFR